MAQNKKDEFDSRDLELAELAKALAHPARVAILQILIESKSCICGDIVDELPLSQSTVSQHLKELKEAGLIKGNIEGAKVCYCINEEEWAAAKSYITELFKSFSRAKCC